MWNYQRLLSIWSNEKQRTRSFQIIGSTDPKSCFENMVFTLCRNQFSIYNPLKNYKMALAKTHRGSCCGQLKQIFQLSWKDKIFFVSKNFLQSQNGSRIKTKPIFQVFQEYSSISSKLNTKKCLGCK